MCGCTSKGKGEGGSQKLRTSGKSCENRENTPLPLLKQSAGYAPDVESKNIIIRFSINKPILAIL
jgi:hypothetical protein